MTVYLLADNDTFDRLESSSGLFEGKIADAKTNPKQAIDNNLDIVRLNPKTLHETVGDDASEEWTYFSNGVRASILVSLHVVKGSGSDLTKELQHQEKFIGRVKKEQVKMAGPTGSTAFIGIIVLTVEPDRDAMIILENLRSDGPFDRCYLMWNTITSQDAPLYFSRHVWPLAVSNLFVRLRSSEPHRLKELEDRLFAWRTFEIRPEIEQDSYENLIRPQMERLNKKILLIEGDNLDNGGLLFDAARIQRFYSAGFELGDRQPTANATSDAQTLSSIELGKDRQRGYLSRKARKQPWVDLDPRASLMCALDSQHKQEQDSEIRRAWGLKILAGEPELDKVLHAAWKKIHNRAGLLGMAARPFDLEPAADPIARLKEMDSAWEVLHKLDAKQEEAVASYFTASQEFNAAKYSFVRKHIRIFVWFLVTLSLGYISLVSFNALSALFLYSDYQRWLAPAIVALSGAVGGGVSLYGGHLLEMRAGGKARTRLVATVEDIRKREQKRYEKLKGIFETSLVFHRTLRVRAGFQRFRELAERGNALLVRKFCGDMRINNPEEIQDYGIEEIESEDHERAKSLQKYQKEQIEWVANSRSVPGGVNEKELKKIMEEHVDAFRNKWQQFCYNADTRAAGALPAIGLNQFLRNFCDCFQGEMERHLEIKYLKLFAEDNTILRDKIYELNIQHTFNLMSCPVQDVYQRENIVSRYLVNTDVNVSDVHVKNAVIELSPIINQLETLAILHEEVPIRLEAGEDRECRVYGV